MTSTFADAFGKFFVIQIQSVGASWRAAASRSAWSAARRAWNGVSGPRFLGDPGAEGADLVPASGLRWPPCRCGAPVCPDYEATLAADGCGVCAALSEQRRRAHRDGDRRAVRECDDELRNHPHRAAAPPLVRDR